MNIIRYVKFHQNPLFLSKNIKQKPGPYVYIGHFWSISRGSNSVDLRNMPSKNSKQYHFICEISSKSNNSFSQNKRKPFFIAN